MTYLIRLLIIYRDLFVFLITIIISLYLIFSNDSQSIHALQGKISEVSSILFKPKAYYLDLLSIKQENMLLNEKIVQLNLNNIKLKNYNEENKILKKMLDFTEESPLKLKTTRIIRKNFSSSINSFSIDIGHIHGVKKNIPVIDIHGLLGKTFIIENNMSIIQSITDKNYRVSIRVGKDSSLGIYIPTHGKYGIIEGVPISQIVYEGDIVYTSGISNIYPANLPVAKVISSSKNPDYLFQKIIVEILADIFNPKFVFIIE